MYEKFSFCQRELIYLEKTESTNRDIKKLICEKNEPVFAVIAAKSQSGGRGRLGRSFFSPAGGLYFSFSLPLTGKEKNIPFITLVSGFAVSLVIEELTGLETKIKWPNDIYINGRKLGGILCELVSGKSLTAVVGIGINLDVSVAEIPTELSEIMTSLSIEGAVLPEKSELIKGICETVDRLIYNENVLSDVSEKLMSALRERSYSIGKKVRYNINGTVSEGVVTDITETGAAVMTFADGSVREIFCGEITQ